MSVKTPHQDNKIRKGIPTWIKVVVCLSLTASWIDQHNKDIAIAKERQTTIAFIDESMRYDLLTHGTGLSPFVSTDAQIENKWKKIASSKCAGWKSIDDSRTRSFLLLLGLTALTAWCLWFPKGQRTVEDWINRPSKSPAAK